MKNTRALIQYKILNVFLLNITLKFRNYSRIFPKKNASNLYNLKISKL